MRSLLRSRPWRSLLLLTGAASFIALSSCMDREPTAVQSSEAPVFSQERVCSAAPGQIILRTSTNSNFSTNGMTAWILDPATGRRLATGISNDQGVFTAADLAAKKFCGGDLVFLKVQFVPFVLINEQLERNGGAYFAPFTGVPEGLNTSPLDPLAVNAIYNPQGNLPNSGNNWMAETLENLNTVLGDRTSRAWVTIPSGAGTVWTSQPMSFTSTTNILARLRSHAVDRNGNRVNFAGYAFGFILAAGKAAEVPCDPNIKPEFRWVCDLPVGFALGVARATDGAFEIPLVPGLHAVEFRGSSVAATKVGRLNAGETSTEPMLVRPLVGKSHYFDVRGHSGLLLAESGLERAARNAQFYLTFESATTVTGRIVEYAPNGNTTTSETTWECGTPNAPTSCIQVSPRRPAYTGGGFFSPGKGQVYFSLGLKNNTAHVCATLSVNGNAVSSSEELNSTRCPKGAYMTLGEGSGQTFVMF